MANRFREMDARFPTHELPYLTQNQKSTCAEPDHPVGNFNPVCGTTCSVFWFLASP
jgi:hypothetical protein